MVTESKRKRKSRTPETAVLDTTTPTSDNDSAASPISPHNSPSPSRRRRGRPRKTPKLDPTNAKTLNNPISNNNPPPPVVANGFVSNHAETAAAARVVPAMDAVVKVFCVHTEPNFSLPWQRKRQYSSSSSGFVIKGRRVLTNAHSVEHYTQVKLKKRGSDTKYLATVLAIGTECDIAMSSETNSKWKRNESPKSEPDETTVLDTPTTINDDIVFSVRNLELISPDSMPSSFRSLSNETPEHESETQAIDVQPSSDSSMFNVEHPNDVFFPSRKVDVIDPILAAYPCTIIYNNNISVESFLPPLFPNDPIFTSGILKLSDLLPSPSFRQYPRLVEPGMLSMSCRIADGFVSTNVETTTGGPPLDAVVKVSCYHDKANFSRPWQRKRQYTTSSSGFIIKGRRVLTNAQSVEYYAQVKLKKRGSNTKYSAFVLAIVNECNIALLTVDDNEFWEGVSPVEFGDLPALQDAVTVVGYPIGGDTISVTSGVVSRIEILSYVHGSTELLGLQIDAAINSGNSGGPAFSDKGNCVGIAFQSLKHEDVENIGYVIPTPVIMHFIQDYEKNGRYTVILPLVPPFLFLSFVSVGCGRVWWLLRTDGGFPILGVEWQKMENPDLRLSMGMRPDQKGVRIRRIDPTAPELTVLKPSDIILSFDGVDIANDGTVPFRHGERIGFSYLVSQKYTGDSAAIKVLRNSETLIFDVKLGTHRRLVPAHNKGKPPSYYIIGGFVFTTVSVPYLRSEYGKDYEFEAPVKLLDKLMHEMPKSLEEQIVVVSQVLVADINIGYEDLVNTQVHAFNGQPVKNLKSLASMVESCNDEYLKFDLEYQQIVVLRTSTAKAATLDILTTHRIPSAMSDDLKT